MDVTQEQRTWARIAGISLLAKYVLELSGDYFTLLARGGDSFPELARFATSNLVAWRAALLAVGGGWIMTGIVAYALYVVLEPVSKRLAQFAFVLRFGAALVGAPTLMFRFAEVRLFMATLTPGPFTLEQLRLLDQVIWRANNAGVYTSWFLMGAGTVIFYLLLMRAGYLPRALAVLGMVGSALVLAMAVVMFVFPVPNNLKMVGLLGLLVDIVVAIWLIAKGLPARSRTPSTA